jgi:DNA-binding protein Fis
MLVARPFPVGLDHVQQVLARTRRTTETQQSHAAYVADLLTRVQSGQVDNAYWTMIEELEPELITQTIKLAQGNQAKAARWMGITRLKLREKLAQLGLNPREPDAP